MLIGASQEPMGTKFENEIEAKSASRALFDEMKAYKGEGLIVVSNQCGIHKGPVFSLKSGEWSKDSIGVSFDEVWERYGEEIIRGEYGITDYDKEILSQVLF